MWNVIVAGISYAAVMSIGGAIAADLGQVIAARAAMAH